jgi:glucose-1-phosphate cytidylyltransferase
VASRRGKRGCDAGSSRLGGYVVKVAILAGGLGTRLAEETETAPKPMVEIGGRPILWHIMKHYTTYGFTEFFIAAGYKSELIKHFFLDYANLGGSMTIDVAAGTAERHEQNGENWTVHNVDPGNSTQTGGRIKRLERWLRDGTFMLTYGDGVSDIDLDELLRFHRSHQKIATITAVRPPSRFGGLIFDGDIVAEFTEKPQIGEGWINGGFMVAEPALFDYLENDETVLEADALEHLAEDRQLVAFRHERFWQCMDTLRDKRLLEALWASGDVPWRTW